MKYLAIMCGLPRSGKTTYAKRLDGVIRISPDDIRLALHGKAYEPRAEAQVWAIAETMARAFIIAEQQIVVDATFISKEHRRRWAALAAEFGLTLAIYWIDTEYDICQARNYGAGAVPDDVIRRMDEHFEVPDDQEGHLIRENMASAEEIDQWGWPSLSSRVED